MVFNWMAFIFFNLQIRDDMPKLIILILLLSSTFCSAQSPYEGVDTFYVGEILGISDTGYWHENYPVIQRTPKGEVITAIQTTAENRLYQNQNKPSMKKFEYRTNVADFKDIQKNCNQLGALGWELVAVTPIVDTITFLLVFKITITD